MSHSNFYRKMTPSFVRAVNLTPTGKPRSADCKAMCSLPFPDAIDNATSNPSNLFFSFDENSFFSCISDLFESNSMKSKGSPWTWNSFANDGPTTITFSHSPFWIRPATCDQVPLPVERSAISSIDFLLFWKKEISRK